MALLNLNDLPPLLASDTSRLDRTMRTMRMLAHCDTQVPMIARCRQRGIVARQLITDEEKTLNVLRRYVFANHGKVPPRKELDALMKTEGVPAYRVRLSIQALAARKLVEIAWHKRSWSVTWVNPSA